MANRLRRNMTEEEFENGYWYAEELKAFAKDIGIPSSSVFASARYINFLSDYLREIPGSTLPDAIEAWNKLKSKNVPKTFAGWKQLGR